MAENPVFEATGFKNVRSELKAINTEMQQLILNGQQGSDRFSQLSKRAGDLKDAVEDAADAQRAFTGAGQFQAVTKAVSGIAGGFTAIQGAITLAGGESKEFEKTMIKLQGAMALTQGLAALEDVPRAFKTIQTVGVNAFKAIKGAIGATGIGLLVIALGTIVAYWDDIKAAISGVTAEQDQLNKATAKNLEMQEANLAAVEGTEQTMKLQGKTEEEIYGIKIKQYDATIAAAQASLTNAKITRDAQIEAAQRNKDILQGVIRFLTAPLTLLLATVDMVGKALGKDFGLEEKFSGGLAKLIFDPEEVKKEGDKTIKEAEDKLRQLNEKRAGMINAHNDKIKQDKQKASDEAAQADEKENQRQLDAIKRRQQAEDELYVAQGVDEQERDRRALQRKNQRAEEEIQAEIDKYQKIKNRTKEEEETLAELLKTLEAVKASNNKNYQDLVTKQTEDGIQKRKEAEEKAAQDFKQRTQDEYNQSLTYVDRYYATLEKNLLNSGKSQKEISKEIERLEIERLERQIQEAKDYGQATEELELQLARRRKENSDREKEERKANLKEQVDAVLSTAAAVADSLASIQEARMAEELKAAGDNAEEQEKIRKKYFEENKKVQIAQAIISAIQSAISAFAALAGIPVVGPVLGGIAAAAALAAGYANVAKIRATTYQGSSGSETKKNAGSMYAEGGILYGPGHDTGGIRTSMGELEGGEFVVNRRATANFLPLLESINTLGNVPGPNVEMQSTPIVKTYVLATDVTSAQEANARISALARM
jgi:hypothetical protein